MRDPNDQRSDSLNENNDACKDSQDNRSNQLDPQHSEYGGGSNSDED